VKSLYLLTKKTCIKDIALLIPARYDVVNCVIIYFVSYRRLRRIVWTES